MTKLKQYVAQHDADTGQLTTLVTATALASAKRQRWANTRAIEEFFERAGRQGEIITDLELQLNSAAQDLAARVNNGGLSEQIAFLAAECVAESDILEHLELPLPFLVSHYKNKAYRNMQVFYCLAMNEDDAERQFAAAGGNTDDVSDAWPCGLDTYFNRPDKAEQRFVLYSRLEEQTMSGKGFWNIRNGWALRQEATVFNRETALRYALPQSLDQDRVWLDVTHQIPAAGAAA